MRETKETEGRARRLLDHLRRKTIASIADLRHSLGQRSASDGPSRKHRDKAHKAVGALGTQHSILLFSSLVAPMSGNAEAAKRLGVHRNRTSKMLLSSQWGVAHSAPDDLDNESTRGKER